MQIDKLALDISIDDKMYDCIWFNLLETDAASPRQIFRLFDWKMNGMLSRALTAPGTRPIIIATMKRIKCPYIVLDDQMQADEIIKKCEGLGLSKILVVYSNPVSLTEEDFKTVKNPSLIHLMFDTLG